MDTMKAVAAMGDGSVRVVDVERTRITDPYQCLVRITACGLCSSTDMKIIGNVQGLAHGGAGGADVLERRGGGHAGGAL